MKEYSILAAASVVLTIMLDALSGVRILQRIEFYIFLIVMLIFKLLVNGYLAGSGIVLYDVRFFLGVRIGSIPVEDFFFGFSMITSTIIFWEYFKRAYSR